MSLNVVNLDEIAQFIERVKKKFKHPLLMVYVDYKVEKLIKTNHHYLEVPFSQLTDQEKDLVKHKEGVYHRAILNDRFFEYIIQHCESTVVLIGRGNVSTEQHVTNLKNIDPAPAAWFSIPIWTNDKFSVVALDSYDSLRQEGRDMNNCLGSSDKNFSSYIYFSLRLEGKPVVSFKISRKGHIVSECKEKHNKVVRREYKDQIDLFMSFFSTKPPSIELDILNLVMFCLFAFSGFIGFFGVVSYFLYQVMGVYFMVGFFSSGYFLFLPIVAWLSMALTSTSKENCSDPPVLVIKKTRIHNFLTPLYRWINDI